MTSRALMLGLGLVVTSFVASGATSEGGGLPSGCPSSPPASDTECADTAVDCWYDGGTRCFCSGCKGGSEYPDCQLVDPPRWLCRDVAPAATSVGVLPASPALGAPPPGEAAAASPEAPRPGRASLYLRLGIGRFSHSLDHIDGYSIFSQSGPAVVVDGSVGVYVSRRTVVRAVVASAFGFSTPDGDLIPAVFLSPGVSFTGIAGLPIDLDLFLGPAFVGSGYNEWGAGYGVGLAFPFAQWSVQPWVQWRACATSPGLSEREWVSTTVLSGGIQLSY